MCHVTGEIVGFREPLLPPVLFTTHFLRILLPLRLLSVNTEKRKTSLPYDKTSLPHILLIFTPYCSLPAAVPPKGGTGLVVRS